MTQRIRYIVLACRISPNATEDQCRSMAKMFDGQTTKATLLREGSNVYEVTRDANIEQINALPPEEQP